MTFISLLWCAGFLGDLLQYNVNNGTWASMQGARGNLPIPRSGCGLSSIGTSLYVFGGKSELGELLSTVI